MYNFNNRLQKLITLDAIRLCKIGEIIQYSFIFLLLLVISMFLLNIIYFNNDYEDGNQINKNNKKYYQIIHIFLIVLRDTILIVLILYYLKKVALLFPSIPKILYPKFIEHTTLDYTIHIALVVVFIEMLPKYKKKILELRNIIVEK